MYERFVKVMTKTTLEFESGVECHVSYDTEAESLDLFINGQRVLYFLRTGELLEFCDWLTSEAHRITPEEF